MAAPTVRVENNSIFRHRLTEGVAELAYTRVSPRPTLLKERILLITIRSRWLLRILGWGTYKGKPREPADYPSYVTASIGLWWHWFRQGVQHGAPDENMIRHSKIEV